MLPSQDVPLRSCSGARGNVLYPAEDGNLTGTGILLFMFWLNILLPVLTGDFTPAASANPAETQQRGTTTSDLNSQCRVEVVQRKFDLDCVMLPAAELCPEAALHQWCSSQQGGQCVLLLALGTASCPTGLSGNWLCHSGVKCM